jgi:hypothetical protein
MAATRQRMRLKRQARTNAEHGPKSPRFDHVQQIAIVDEHLAGDPMAVWQREPLLRRVRNARAEARMGAPLIVVSDPLLQNRIARPA